MPTPKAGYYIDGVRIPGTTTIISRWKDSGALIHWAWKQGKEGIDYRQTRDKAGDTGTAAHNLIEAFIKNTYTPDYYNEVMGVFDDAQKLEVANAFAAFRFWWDQTKIQIVDQETQMVSRKYRFGGTPDALGLLNGRLLLGDWKTSGGIYSDYVVQVAAYRQLYHENTDHKIEGAFLCRFDKENGRFEQHDFTSDQLDVGFEAFVHMREMYDLDAKLKRFVK